MSLEILSLVAFWVVWNKTGCDAVLHGMQGTVAFRLAGIWFKPLISLLLQ